MRILIIEDEPDISTLIQKNLEGEGFVVDLAKDGEEGSYLARTNDYDLMILDCVLPKKGGLSICQEVRAANKNTPILILSVCSEINNKVKLLNSGADDFLAKPFSFSELLARVRALIRRPKEFQFNPLSFENLVIDCLQQKAFCGKREVYLTRKEFLLLEYFMKNIGVVLSRGTLMEHVWNIETDPFSNTIEAHVLNLRKKIDTGRRKLIHTIPGRGYKMDVRR